MYAYNTALTTFEAFWVFNHCFFPESKVSILFRLFSLICAGMVGQEAQQAHCRPAPSSRTEYSVGQVWLSTRFFPVHSESKKLTSNYIGSFEVSVLVNPVSVRLKLPRNMRNTQCFARLTSKVYSLQSVVPSFQDPSTHPGRG